jgi:hypothetical protein
MGIDLDLSRRAVAAGWKWQAGALTCSGVRVTFERGEHGYGCSQRDQGIAQVWHIVAELPDFNDAATRGVMLQQVRERWDAPTICTDCDGLRWSVVRVDGTVLAYGDSETAALVCALEAAPKEKGI